MSTSVSRSRVTHCLVFALTFTVLVLCAFLLRPLLPHAAATLSSPQVWVDDDYCDGCPNGGHTWGVDAFATMQDGFNAVAAGGTVHVAAGLYAEHLTIDQDVTIDGAGQADTILDAGGTGRAVQIVTATVSISGLTIRNGSVPAEGGGGIESSGVLTLNHCTVMQSHAAGGGGIHVLGTAVLSDCQILSNTAQYSGAGIYNEGTATLIDTALISNTAPYGGGLDNLGRAVLENCTVEQNVAPGTSSTGAGLLNESAAMLSVTGGTVSGNATDYAGGGIYNSVGGTLDVTDCTLHANTNGDEHALPNGGATIHNMGMATLTRCDLSGGGYIVLNAGTMAVVGSRVTGGGYRYRNVGLYNAGTLTVADSMIDHYSGYYPGGVYNIGGNVTITRSRLSYIEAGKNPFAIGTGAITITYSTLEANEGISAAVIAHSLIISNNTEDVSASTLVGNDILNNWPRAVGNVVHLNNVVGNEREFCALTGIARAQANWWGSASGPSGAGPGTGDPVCADTDYTPWLGTSVLTETVATGRVTNGTLDARATSGIEVDVTGATTLFLGKLAGNPGGPQPFVPVPGGFFDVLQEDASGLSQVTIRYYYPEGPEESVLGLWWWDGAVWRKCSDQGINTTDLPGYGGYLWARVTSSTVPALDKLSGGPFAAAENWLVLQQGVEGYTGSEDTYLYQHAATDNYCSDTLMKVGYKQQNAGLLRFALPSLPDDVVMTTATLEVYAHAWSGENLSLGTYVVTRTVNICEASWQQAQAGNNWGSAGCNDITTDRRPAPESTVTTTGIRQWYSFDVTAAVRGWLQGTLANNGLLLRAMAPDEISFYFASAEYDTVEYGPRLIVKWRPAPTPTPTQTVPRPGLTVRGHVRLNSASGPGLPGVTIDLSLASYPPSHTSTTDANGYYELPFIYIPGDEMITVQPSAPDYLFDPPLYHWRHWYGVENGVRDFVAYATTPTPTASPTATQTPTVTPTATATHTLTPTPSTRRVYLPLVLKGRARSTSGPTVAAGEGGG